MAKKKVEVNLDRSPMRDEPLTGDVEIHYHGDVVYATSETNQINVLTENKVCLHDIIVDYTKPEAETVTIPIYYRIGNGDEVLFDTMNLIPGTLYRHSETISCGGVSGVQWKSVDTGGINPYPPIVCVCSVDYVSKEHSVSMAMYTPSAIPHGYNRIVIALTEAK